MSDALPVITSFYCGAEYYYEAADRLRGDCERLGLEHDIVELTPPPDLDWAQICRQKPAFYLQQVVKHDRPIMWVDVDCRIRAVPEMLRGCRFDIAGYARMYRRIRDYDPYVTARFWIPGLLFFNATPAARELLELMVELDAATVERVTDDWLLHEAWTQTEAPLNVGLLSPDTVARNLDLVDDRTVFVYGDSGLVDDFRDTVVQHMPRDLFASAELAAKVTELNDNPRVRARIVGDLASDFMRGRERETAAKLVRAAMRRAPDDLASMRQYARLLRSSGRLEEAYGALAPFLERDPDNGQVLETMVQIAMASRDYDTARTYIDRLIAHEEPRWQDYGRSASFDLAREVRARELGLEPADRPQLWWMKRPFPGNFGDVLSPYIVERLTGKPPRFAGPKGAILGIGSIIKFAEPGCRVWGSGTARVSDELSDRAEYCAVRGPLTREIVLRDGGTCPDVYGDPGLLLPRFYSPPRRAPKYALGLIRHVNHAMRATLADGVREISLRRVGDADVEAFVDELLDCEVVLSTSLHGLITAHAYGIPARWCEFSAQARAVPGDGIKFRDYFLSVGLPEQTPLDLSGLEVVDESLGRHVDRTVELDFSPECLIEAYPSAD